MVENSFKSGSEGIQRMQYFRNKCYRNIKRTRRKSNFDTIHFANGDSIAVNETSVFHKFIQEIRDETHRYAISIQKRK